MFSIHHNALHILSVSLIDLEGTSAARHLAAALCSVSRTMAGQGGLNYLLLGLLLVSPHYCREAVKRLYRFYEQKLLHTTYDKITK